MANIKSKYYSLSVNEKQADIYIYGDIVSWEWLESDVSSYTLAKEIEALPEDIELINVFLNSYGGEVAEAFAICNCLQRHPARIKTHCDGFACSAAADIFMVGDDRIMSDVSLLWIHNAWIVAAGDYKDLRKEADDLETINDVMMKLFLDRVKISEEELRAMMDEETWITPEQALEMGFATAVVEQQAANKPAASLDVRQHLIAAIMALQEPAPAPQQDPDPAPDLDSPALADVIRELVRQELAAQQEPEVDTVDPADPVEDPPEENAMQDFIAAMIAAERSNKNA